MDPEFKLINKPVARPREGGIESDEEIRQRLNAELRSFGIPVVPEILDHLFLLEKNSKFNFDSRMILEGIQNVMKLIESFSLNLVEKKRVFLATYLHDIGKSSSSEGPDCQLAVTKLFSVENLNPKQTVEKTIQDNFPNEKPEMISHLEKIGVASSTTMREFWDLHAIWTKEVLDRLPDIFDKQTRIIAASHHIDRKINPYGIDINDVQQVSNELKYSIFLLMAIDQYQASHRRSKANHETAMKYLEDNLKLYDGDVIMESILKTVGQLGSTNNLFPKTLASAGNFSGN